MARRYPRLAGLTPRATRVMTRSVVLRWAEKAVKDRVAAAASTNEVGTESNSSLRARTLASCIVCLVRELFLLSGGSRVGTIAPAFHISRSTARPGLLLRE